MSAPRKRGPGRPPAEDVERHLQDVDHGFPGVVVWLWHDDLAGGEYALSYDIDKKGGPPKDDAKAYTCLSVRRESNGTPHFFRVSDEDYDDWHQSLALSLVGHE